MLILCTDPSPGVVCAVQAAALDAERFHEVGVRVITAATDAEILSRSVDTDVVVFELHRRTTQQVVDVITRLLTRNLPRHFVVVQPQHSHHADVQAFFTLGRLGVKELPTTLQAQTRAWWLKDVLQLVTPKLITAVRLKVVEQIPQTEARPLLLTIARYAHLPTVRELADKMYAGSFVSPATMRKNLWMECKKAQLHSPEAALHAIRSLKLKFLLDSGECTLTKIAGYMSVATPRLLNDSCTIRLGVSLTALRALPLASVLHNASLVLRHAQSLGRLVPPKE